MTNPHKVTTAKTPQQIQQMLDEWALEVLRELLHQYIKQLTQR